ncbi:TniQ family protein [Pseudoalteromonas sp. HM-SA03]|uniref:TnsD family Tn7-like transposition protein n=1 Tax=Pseudoalteromonas sp. HM-SA03 TaxID=2029678 RepID=UPI0015958496|nr:TniQ family protein [Pseudoalteromonas sp. HM-SA03]
MVGYCPNPYPDELLYSLLARCRVHLGIADQKVFLRMYFSDDKVTAVPDLPSHLIDLVSNSSSLKKLGIEELIYKHTLLPLFIPFIPSDRKSLLIETMKENHGESLHVRSGISAGRIKPPRWFRICPICLKDMKETLGEFYWPRLWQVRGVEICLNHNCKLLDSKVPFRSQHRHEFTPATPDICANQIKKVSVLPAHGLVIYFIKQLLQLGDIPSPNYMQWSHFYHDLAQTVNARKGEYINHELLVNRFTRHFSTDYLKNYGLIDANRSLHWLKSLFRKHRKSFSYLEHILAWVAFSPTDSITEIIDAVNQEPAEKIHAVNQVKFCPLDERKRNRSIWVNVLSKSKNGIKFHRNNGYGGLYAWLFRYDREWLTEINKKYHLPKENHSCTDWRDRDRKLVRRLLKIKNKAQSISGIPRMSRNWFLLKLPHRASVENHIDKLNLCRCFFERYTETIPEYQIRRVMERLVSSRQTGTYGSRWELERACGLDRKKLPELTEQFLSWIEVKRHANNF